MGWTDLSFTLLHKATVDDDDDDDAIIVKVMMMILTWSVQHWTA